MGLNDDKLLLLSQVPKQILICGFSTTPWKMHLLPHLTGEEKPRPREDALGPGLHILDVALAPKCVHSSPGPCASSVSL